MDNGNPPNYEEKRRQGEGFARQVIEALGQGVTAVDENGRFIYVNPAYARMVDRPVETLIGQSPLDVTHPDDQERLLEAQRRHQAGQTSTYETRLLRPDETVVHVQITGAPRRENDVIAGSVATVTDITARKQAEEALRQSERRYRLLAQHATDMISVHDEEGYFQYVSPSCHRLLGYEPEELLGQSAYEFLHPEDLAGIRESHRTILSLPAIYTVTYRIRKKNGDYTWFETTDRVVISPDADGKREIIAVSRDVSERKHMEKRLGQGKAFTEAVINSLPGVFFLLDNEGQLLSWNQNLEHVTGYTAAEIMQRGPLELVAPADREKAAAELRKLMTEGRATAEIRYVTEDGAQIPYLFTGKCIIVGGNSYYVGMGLDISARKEAERAERRRRRELEAIRRASLSLAASLDLSHVLRAVLNALLELAPAHSADIFFYDGQRLTFGLGMTPEGVQHEPYAEPRPHGLAYTVARTGATIFVEDSERHSLFQDAPASWGRFAIVGLPLRIESDVMGVMDVSYPEPRRFTDSEKRVLQLLAAETAVAIHNARSHSQVQRHAEELEERVAERTATLERERARFQAVLDAAGEAIYFTDADGNIRYANPTTERITGYAPAQLIGQPAQIWRGPTPPAVIEEMETTLARGEAWQGNLINRRKDGALYDASVTLSPLQDADDLITGFVGVQRDISQLKELARLREQFVSRIGHELRTPLTNLQLYLNLLQQGRPQERLQYIGALQRAATRLRKLIEGFLELSRLTADPTPVATMPTDANAVVRELVEGQQPDALKRELGLDYALEDALPLVAAERDMLAQALVQLLQNALDYTPPGGRITIATTLVTQGEYDWVTIAVQDTGPGLTGEEMPRLFDRFYRGSAAADFTVPGAGLGLSICREILNKLGGRVTVQSQEGEGATFTIWLKPV